jgi:hypothetical protein
MRTLLLGLFVFFNSQILGQNLAFKAQYSQAKALIAQAQYTNAIKILQSIENEASANQYRPYVSYYLAVCYIKTEAKTEAEKQLIFLENAYQNWNKADHIRYALCINYLETDIVKSIEKYTSIGNTVLKNKAEVNIKSAANQLSVKELAALIAVFENVSFLDEILKQKKESIAFGPEVTNLPIYNSNQIQKKDKNTIQVAVLMPFGSATSEANSYVLDIMEGMKWAQKKLQTENIQVKLNLYDVGNEPATMIKLLTNKDFLQNDMLIGPLHAETNKYAQWASKTYNKLIINPLSHNSTMAQINSNSFNCLASKPILAAETAKALTKKFIGPVLIISQKDTSQANAYANICKNSGVPYVKIGLGQTIPKTTFSHVFLAFDAQMAKNECKILCQKLGETPIVYIKENLQEPYSQFFNESNQLYFVNQEFVNENDGQLKQFKNEYFQSIGGVSNSFTYKGHDLLLFWARSFQKYQSNTASMIQGRSYDSGYLLNGINFGSNSHENKAYSLTEWRNGIEILVDSF